MASGPASDTVFVVAANVPTLHTCQQLTRTLASIFEFHPDDHVLIVNNDSPEANMEAPARGRARADEPVLAERDVRGGDVRLGRVPRGLCHVLQAARRVSGVVGVGSLG